MLVCPEKQEVTICWKEKGKRKRRTNQGFKVQEHLHEHRARGRVLWGELAGRTEEQRKHQDRVSHSGPQSPCAFLSPYCSDLITSQSPSPKQPLVPLSHIQTTSMVLLHVQKPSLASPFLCLQPHVISHHCLH